MALTDDLCNELEIAARYALAGPLANGGRVLDLGGYSVPGLRVLLESDVAQVVVAHAKPAAFATLLQEHDLDGIEVIDAALDADSVGAPVDLLICHDLDVRLAAQPDLLETLRAHVAPTGFLITALANPQGKFLSEVGGKRFTSKLTYDALVEQVTAHFPEMTLLGQTPLAGALFFDFADGPEDADLSLDRSLLPDESEEAGWYILIFGPERRPHPDLSIVQLPFTTLLQAAKAAAAPAAAPAPPAPAPDSMRLSQLEAERNALRRDLQAAHAALSMVSQTPVAPPVADRPQDDVKDTRIAQLETELRVLAEHVAAINPQNEALEQELQRVRNDKASYEAQIKDLLDEVGDLRGAHDSLTEEVGGLQANNAVAQEQLVTMKQTLDVSRDAHNHEHGARLNHEKRINHLNEELTAARQELAGLRHPKQNMPTHSTRGAVETAIAPTPATAADGKHDAIGRKLDPSVDELEDLLQSVEFNPTQR